MNREFLVKMRRKIAARSFRPAIKYQISCIWTVRTALTQPRTTTLSFRSAWEQRGAAHAVQRKTNDNYMEYFKIAFETWICCSVVVVVVHTFSLSCLRLGMHLNSSIERETNANRNTAKHGEEGTKKKTQRVDSEAKEHRIYIKWRKKLRQQWRRRRRRLDIIMCSLLFIITVLLLYRRHYFVVQMCIVAQSVSSVAARSDILYILNVATMVQFDNNLFFAAATVAVHQCQKEHNKAQIFSTKVVVARSFVSSLLLSLLLGLPLHTIA